MTTETLLTDIEHPGTYIVQHGYLRRRELALQVHALQKLGHALVVDELVDAGMRDTSGDLRIHHYTSCKRCKRGAL
jgi:hypothetical protein